MKALPFLLTGAAFGVLASCDRPTHANADPEWWRLEGRRVELAQRLELLKLRSEKIGARVEDAGRLHEEAVGASARLAELETTARSLKGEISALRAESGEVRERWVRSVRSKAVGMRFDALAGRAGRNYEDVLITRVSDIGVEFSHRDGLARLSANDLSPSQLEFFGLDPEEAVEAREREAMVRLAYESEVDRAIALAETAEKSREEARQLARAEARRSRDLDRIAALTAASVSTRSRLDEAPRRMGRGSSSVYFHSYSRPGTVSWGCSPAYSGQRLYDIKTWGFSPPGMRTYRPPVVRTCPPPASPPPARRPILPDSFQP